MKDFSEIDRKEAEARVLSDMVVMKNLIEILAACEFSGRYPKPLVIDIMMEKLADKETYTRVKEQLVRFGRIAQSL